MELLLESIKMDWPVLLPIFLCSILVLGVVISKWSFYQKNQRDITVYMRELNKYLYLGRATILYIIFTNMYINIALQPKSVKQKTKKYFLNRNVNER